MDKLLRKSYKEGFYCASAQAAGRQNSEIRSNKFRILDSVYRSLLMLYLGIARLLSSIVAWLVSMPAFWYSRSIRSSSDLSFTSEAPPALSLR